MEILPLPDSPGEKRRSFSFHGSASSDSLARDRSRSWGASEKLRRLSPSFRRKRAAAQDTSSTASASTTSSQKMQVIAAGEPQDGCVVGVGGEVIELSEAVLTGPLKREGYLQKHGRRLGVS